MESISRLLKDTLGLESDLNTGVAGPAFPGRGSHTGYRERALGATPSIVGHNLGSDALESSVRVVASPLSSLIHNYAHFILLLLLCFLMQFFLSNHIDPNLLSASNATPLHRTANPGIMQVAKYRLYHKVEVST